MFELQRTVRKVALDLNRFSALNFGFKKPKFGRWILGKDWEHMKAILARLEEQLHQAVPYTCEEAQHNIDAVCSPGVGLSEIEKVLALSNIYHQHVAPNNCSECMMRIRVKGKVEEYEL